MHRLLKISLDQALLSAIPALLWFCLSIIIDSNLINVFTLTYPIQFLYYIIRSPFATGANIDGTRRKDKNIIMSGVVLCCIVSLIAHSIVLLNLDSYIQFMSMDPSTYRLFATYAIVISMLQTIFSTILDKLHFEDKNSLSNCYSIIFALLQFSTTILIALLTQSSALTVAASLSIVTIFTIYTVIHNLESFKFSFHFLRWLKLDAATFFGCIFSFFIYLFGFSNVFSFGAEYTTAITFVTLITDAQWDVLDAISSMAKIDISKHRFNFKKSLKNSYRLLIILLASSTLMFIFFYRFYDLNLPITLLFFGLEYIDFFISPIEYINTPFLIINWSSSKATVNKLVSRCLRFSLSLLPTPFCTVIASIIATAYQNFTTNLFLRRYFIIERTGKIRARSNNTDSSAKPRYHDLTINIDD